MGFEVFDFDSEIFWLDLSGDLSREFSVFNAI